MFKMFSTLSFLGLLTFSGVQAQPGHQLQAKVPFNFTVANTSLPAGNYNVTYNSAPQLLLMQGWNLGAAFTTAIPNAQAKGTAKLIFHCYEGACQLAEVSQGAGGASLKVPQPRQERRIAFITRVVSMAAAAK